jgi:hypothetical protein
MLLVAGVATATYLAGLYQGQRRGIQMLQAEAAGNLTQRLEALSLLRLGEATAAVAGLEDEADQLALSIATNAAADRRVLISAKAYRSVVPPTAARRDELNALFATLPAPEPAHCDSALRKFVFGSVRNDK